MIPKKIHYVWFGGSEKPPETVAFIRGWRSLMPDHEVIEWNESNINVSSHPLHATDVQRRQVRLCQ
ncbi:MAG: hypothetical protein IPO90_05950 [Flavobacteriales bacterium]|nr:hypothetical protein [Flavobacteriales bacterium]